MNPEPQELSALLKKRLPGGRKAVTVGIGVLCSTRPKPHEPRPDAIVLIADTMGSTETDSTDELHKMWLNDNFRFYATGAGDLDLCGELVSIVENELPAAINESGGRRTHSIISTALGKSFHILKSVHFQMDIFPSLSIYKVGRIVPNEKVIEEWQRFCLNIHMLFATFDETGQAYLYLVGQFWEDNGTLSPKAIHVCESPGCRAIGTGGDNAEFWLHYRHQFLGRSVKQSAYHAYEAKQMAARAPTVNENTEVAIILPGNKHHHLTEDNPVIDGCPISLPELGRMFNKYGPQDTLKDLGHHLTKPSIVQRSKRER